MKESLKRRILEVCNKKITSKGSYVSFSFYVFSASKNDDHELLMEAAEWSIMTHQFDRFEKSTKIKEMIISIYFLIYTLLQILATNFSLACPAFARTVLAAICA